MKTTLLLKYFLWGMLIFALSAGLLGFGSLRTLELKTLNLGFLWRARSQTRMAETTESRVVPLSVWGYASNEAYLRNARQIVQDLKKAGAKVVVIPLPDNLVAVPRILALLNAINRDSIVVFSSAMRALPVSSSGFSLMNNHRRNWWVRHPALHRVDMLWGVSSVYTDFYSLLYRFVPYEFKDFDTGMIVPDVSLQALKLYLGYPDGPEIRLSPYDVLFGTHVIPLERDGFAYVKYSFNLSTRGGVYASVGPETDSLIYFPIDWSGKPEERNLDASWRFYKDKIVILDWSGYLQLQFPSYGWAYAQIIDAILSHRFVVRYNDYDLLLIVMFVLLLSILSYNVRGTITASISILLALGVVVLSIWLFDRYSILFDPVYVLVPILLCGVILPVVKLAEERRMLEQTVKSLEEEKRRLEQLRRDQSLPM